MNNLILKRQKTNEPKLDELFEIISDLKDFLSQDPDINDRQWNRNLNAVLDFQDADGSFKLFDSYRIPSDARVDFCYIPTYICSTILIKAYLAYPHEFTLRERSTLAKGLEASCARNLRGHGFDGFKGQIEALDIFISAGSGNFLTFTLRFALSSASSLQISSPISGSWNPMRIFQVPGAKAMRKTSKG